MQNAFLPSPSKDSKAQMSVLERSFDDIVFEAINESLISIFGEDTARSVNFYIDPNIALTDADAYVKGLKRMFMEGAGLIVVRICERVSQLTGVTKAEGSNLGEFLRDVRGRYVSQTGDDRSGRGNDGSLISIH